MRYLAAILSTLLLVAGARAQSENPPVAEILGQRIFAADLATPNGASADGTSVDAARGRVLRDRIWSAIFADYARARRIAPTDSEIGSNIENHRRLRAIVEAERVDQRAKATEDLKSANLPASRRAQAQALLDSLDKIAEFDRRRAEEARDPQAQAMHARAERVVAEQWTRQWKLNQALHREFGGRIIFQQAGWEPIDAYRALIERYEANGSFVVHDPSLRASVYAYFDHRFVYLDETKARFYFEKPYWERTREEMRRAGF